MWHKEADIVIVGFGGAGAAAAITAHDAGAKVIVLEKNAQGGGSTRCSRGSIREYLDLEKAITYFHAISFETTEREVYQSFVQESSQLPRWIEQLGGELERRERVGFPPAPHVVFPHVAGAEGIGGRFRVKGPGDKFGATLFNFFASNVVKRGVEILYQTPAAELVASPAGEVIGVVAEGSNGQVRVKVRRGVILCCGGFERNPEMQMNFLGMKFPFLGNPGNTGDGIRMAQAVGADLWHMSGLSCSIGYQIPGFEVPFQHRIRTGEYIYVDQHGKRFVDEAGTDVHAMAFSFSHLDHQSLKYPRIPSYVIFDETARLKGPVASEVGWVTDSYEWSRDNSEEIKKGWIKSAGTIRELAPQVGLRSEALQATVSQYNLCCAGGYDPDFGRRQETLSPLARPPFYAIPIQPCLINTQGGPKRNERGQVLNVHRKPIPRLYSAGELGSIWGVLYPGAGNVTEALTFGRIAAKNAAAETPWRD